MSNRVYTLVTLTVNSNSRCSIQDIDIYVTAVCLLGVKGMLFGRGSILKLLVHVYSQVSIRDLTKKSKYGSFVSDTTGARTWNFSLGSTTRL